MMKNGYKEWHKWKERGTGFRGKRRRSVEVDHEIKVFDRFTLERMLKKAGVKIHTYNS